MYLYFPHVSVCYSWHAVELTSDLYIGYLVYCFTDGTEIGQESVWVCVGGLKVVDTTVVVTCFGLSQVLKAKTRSVIFSNRCICHVPYQGLPLHMQ